MVLMGIVALQVGVTNVRTVDGRIRLETAAPRTSRRDTEERCNRHAAAENMIVIYCLSCNLIVLLQQ